MLSETLQASQQKLGNTRLGSLVGCGVDCSLAATEAVVNKILPPTDDEETGEEDDPKKAKEGEDSALEEACEAKTGQVQVLTVLLSILVLS